MGALRKTFSSVHMAGLVGLAAILPLSAAHGQSAEPVTPAPAPRAMSPLFAAMIAKKDAPANTNTAPAPAVVAANSATAPAPAKGATNNVAPAPVDSNRRLTINDDIQIKAGEYAISHRGIGIAIFKGAESRIPGTKVGETFQSLFTKYNLESQYFVDETVAHGGTYVIFVVKDVPFGPYDLKQALDASPMIAQMCRGAHYEEPTPVTPSPCGPREKQFPISQ